MTDYITVEEGYVQALIKNAAWDKAGVALSEKKDSGQKKGDKPKGKAEKDDDKPDFTTGARKGDKSKTHAGKDYEDDDDDDEMAKAQEAVEEHVCPLCESVLENALTDEQVQEHVSQIKDALQSLEEDDDDVDEDEDEDTDEAKSKRESKVMKKVEQLKAAAKGK